MPNLLLTDHRHRDCSSDFAPERFISWQDLVIAVNYFDKAREEIITLRGDEPTSHPDFINAYRYMQARGFTVAMFSSGCMSPEKLEALRAALVPHRSDFIITVSEDRHRDDPETRRQDRFFRSLGSATSLRVNLQGPDPDLDLGLDLIGEYRLRRSIHLGLAHPITGEISDFLPPTRYSDIAETITTFAGRCEQQGVSLTLGCGFTLCDFTDAQLGTLLRANADLRFRCGPVIDVGPDLNTRACSPLSQLQPQPLEQYPSFDAVRRFYIEHVQAETLERGFFGVYKKCEPCRYRKRGQCSGGCRSYAFTEGC